MASGAACRERSVAGEGKKGGDEGILTDVPTHV